MPNQNEASYYAQVQESIQSIFELTTRVDERVQLMMKKQDNLEDKIDSQMKETNALATRVTILESRNGVQLQADLDKVKDLMHQMELKISHLDKFSATTENRWKTIGGFTLQIVWVILAAYLLFKLGIQAPAVP